MKYFITFFIVMLVGCSPRLITSVNQTDNHLDALLNHPVLAGAHVGLLVCDAETGEVIADRQSEKLFMPASNMKLATTAAALYQLGADYRFITKIVLNGVQKDTVFYGDVYLVGGADPTLCPYYQNDSTAIFSDLIFQLQKRNIHAIHGNLTTDVSMFDDQPLGLGWSWENEPFNFSAQISPLSCYENCVRIILNADESGKVNAAIFPKYHDISIKNKVNISTDQTNHVRFTRRRGSNDILLSGELPAGKSDTSYCSVHGPADFFKNVFTSELHRNGITVDSLMNKPESNQIFIDTLKHASMPLGQIIQGINTDSRNIDAELLFRTMGFERFDKGTDQTSTRAVNEFLVSIGIDTTAIRIVDGSGLSRKNLLSPQAIVKLLLWMYHAPTSDVFINSLARAGTNGTLAKYLTLRGRLKAKTGTLDAVKCLSGYLETNSGRMLVFSMMMNHYTAPHAEIVAVQQKICEYLLTIE